MNQPISQSQLPICSVCQLEPLPQSTQYSLFIILEFVLVFINFKFAIMVLMVGYMLCKTMWICPLCKRDVAVAQGKVFPTQYHIIIRLNDCMVLMSKTKFRVVASILIGLLIYRSFTEPSYEYKPRAAISKNWRSLVTNCGYDVYIQNSFKFNYLYSLYEETSNWQLEGIYLQKQQQDKLGYTVLKIKMNPTQFKDSNTQDLYFLIKNYKQILLKGEIIKMYGSWAGHQQHIFIFVGSRMEKIGKKIDDMEKQIEVITHGLLRGHSQ